MRYSRVPPVQPHRWLSVVTSDTAHQTHLNKFIGLGTRQNALLRLKKKKSLQATAKSTIWYDRCSSGKLTAIEVPEGGRIGRVPGKGEGVSGPCPRGTEESELSFLETSSQMPSCMENGSSVIPLPDWCTWGTRLSAQTFASFYWTQHPASSMCDSQPGSTWADRQGHKTSNFCKSPAQQDSRAASEAESWGQDKRGLTLAAGWARGWGSGPCLRRAAKQEGLTTRVHLLVYEQRLCLCVVADPAVLTVVSGTTRCHKAVEAKKRGTCLDVTNLLCHPWQRFAQEVWQWSR